MSILFVLLMFLLIMSISYFVRPQEQPARRPEIVARPQPPRLKREYGFEIPETYAFHPGHMWVNREGADDARVGVDGFVTNLMGKINHIEICGVNRWVRQGQKLITITSDGTSVDLLSPVEGVVMAINSDALKDPSLVTRHPYSDGWIATVKSPDLAVNEKNLLHGAMVAPWMQNNVKRLNAMLSELSPTLAQDGGQAVSGLLPQLTPELRQKLVKEFFLS